MSWMLQDPSPGLILLGLVALVALVLLFWRSRESFVDLERRGHPRNERRDRSARPGPRTRIREWLDPRTDRRDD